MRVGCYQIRGIVSCDSDADSNRAMPTACDTSKTQILRNKGPFLPHCSLFLSAVPKRGRSKRGGTQKHANVRNTARMNAKERKCKSAKERKRAQKGAKGRKREQKSASA